MNSKDVRDHTRPEMHKAFDMDPTEYDFKVFEITSEISKQVFPLTLDLDNPKFRAGLERLRRINEASQAAKAQGVGKVKQLGLNAAAFAAFARLYLLPTKRNALPEQVRLTPAW